jgi:phosphate transport system permease protein
MIRMSVLPFGRSAIIGASMLGLGRALGETMAVTIILSVSGAVTFNLVSSGNPSTIAANIALDFPESSGLDINALIASGLVLFAITLAVNMAARAVNARTERARVLAPWLPRPARRWRSGGCRAAPPRGSASSRSSSPWP